MSHFITTGFVDYNKIQGKSVIEISIGVYMTVEPIEVKVTVDGKETIEKKLKMSYVDDTAGYKNSWVFDRVQVRQWVTLFQVLQGQLSSANTDNSDNGSCSRGVTLK